LKKIAVPEINIHGGAVLIGKVHLGFCLYQKRWKILDILIDYCVFGWKTRGWFFVLVKISWLFTQRRVRDV